MDLNPARFLAPWSAFEFATHARAARCKLVVLSMAWLTRLEGGELGWEPSEAARSKEEEEEEQIKGQDGKLDAQTTTTPIISNPVAQEEEKEEEEEEEDPHPLPLPLRSQPDAATQAYWLARLAPLVAGEADVLVVCANRCGVEGGAGGVGSGSGGWEPGLSSSVGGGAHGEGEGGHGDGGNGNGETNTEARYAGSSAVLCVGRGRARVGGSLGRGEEGVLRVDAGEGEGGRGTWKGGWVLRRGVEEGGEGDEGERLVVWGGKVRRGEERNVEQVSECWESPR